MAYDESLGAFYLPFEFPGFDDPVQEAWIVAGIHAGLAGRADSRSLSYEPGAFLKAFNNYRQSRTERITALADQTEGTFDYYDAYPEAMVFGIVWVVHEHRKHPGNMVSYV